MGGLRRALAALGGAQSRARLAQSAAAYLTERLPADYVVLPRYEPRDDGDDEVPVVVLGPHGVLVLEPCDEDGELVCFQDHWYQSTAPGRSHPLHNSPSKRARWHAARVKSDLASGGFIYTSVESVVVLTRGHPGDVRSSCVPVCAGLDVLVRELLRHATAGAATAERTRALADALAGQVRLVSA